MKYFIYIMLCFTWFYSALAQVPGYRGKKFMIKVNTKGMPVIGALLGRENYFDLNARFSVGADVVLSKSITAGVSMEQVNDIITLEKYGNYLQSGYNGARKYETQANFYGYNFGANLKFFTHKTSGSIAPFGRFFIVEYLYSNIDVSDDGSFYASGKKDLNHIGAHSLALGLGSQKVLFNKITFEANVKAGLNTYGIHSFAKIDKRLVQDEVYKASTSKMATDFLLTVGIGIGFLAF
jgi:hypothetical protein